MLLGVQQPSPRRGFPPADALLFRPLRAAAAPLSSWGGGDGSGSGDIRGAASDSDSLKESVRTLTQEQRSRDTKKAFWMPSPTTSAAQHSGLPQPAAVVAGAPPVAAAGACRRRPRAPPRRKAKGTHRGEEVEEEEAAVLAAARVDMLRGWGSGSGSGLAASSCFLS